MKLIKNIPIWLLGLAIAFYFAGVFFIPHADIEYLKERGIAHQEEYTYTDSEGEDHEGETYIDIDGLGTILTYKDVYFSSIGMFIVALVAGYILYDIKENRKVVDELRHVIFANCIIGVLLIWMTSKVTVVSTILFWLGIITSYICEMETSNDK